MENIRIYQRQNGKKENEKVKDEKCTENVGELENGV